MVHKSIEMVSVSHYSATNSIKSFVIEINDDYFLLKLTKEFAILNFLEGDPVVTGWIFNSEVFVCSGIIISVDVKNGIIKIKTEEIHSIIDKSMAERFPVSLYADIRINGSKKREIAIIKDLSLTGMNISSKLEVSEGDQIEFDAYLGKIVIPLRATILWKKQAGAIYYYGIQIIYSDFNTKNTIKLNLQMLKDEMERAIRDIRN